MTEDSQEPRRGAKRRASDVCGVPARASRILRAAAIVALVFLVCGPAVCARAQETAVSALPPPVTRGQYRASWFDFLTAFSENDAAGADRALEAMVRAARKVGVHRLSDFSRTAVYLGRRAELLGQKDRAARAYDAALLLDPDDPDAVLGRISFLARTGRTGQALRSVPAGVVGILATRESRVAVLSNAALWLAAGIAGALAGIVLTLCVRHSGTAGHDVREAAGRRIGRGAAIPLGLAIAGVPLFLGFGPGWLALYWAALDLSVRDGARQRFLAGGLLAVALIPPLARRRHPLQHRAAIPAFRGRTRPLRAPRGRQRGGWPEAGIRRLPGGLRRVVPSRRVRRASGDMSARRPITAGRCAPTRTTIGPC